MPGIKRRDFIGGVALAAGSGFVPLHGAPGRPHDPTTLHPDAYPPARTGLRGAHEGSFEAAHELAWHGKRFERPAEQTDETYDLVVVGGGVSGLAAAWMFRDRVGPGSRILILDNHDDFGGHAKRNEFDVDGKRLLGYGGSVLIVPRKHSEPMSRLFDGLGVDLEALHDGFDGRFYLKYIRRSIYFDPAHFNARALLPNPFGSPVPEPGVDYREAFADFPVSDATKQKLHSLYGSDRSAVLPGLTLNQTVEKLTRTAYTRYLRDEVGLTDEGIRILVSMGAEGTGNRMDVESVRMAILHGLPVPGLDKDPALMQVLGLGGAGPGYRTYHFPDGNAGMVRMMVRSLIPNVTPGLAPGAGQADTLLAAFDYGQLDRPNNATRIRLNSLVVDIRHDESRNFVDVCYLRDGTPARVRARHCIAACWNRMLSHICPEIGSEQAAALAYAEKPPIGYITIALRRWQAIADSGAGYVHVPEGFANEYLLSLPVSLGDYRYAADPDDPVVVCAEHYPATYNDGNTPREQNRLGRHRMLSMPFAEYERNVLREMDAIWGPYGMDVSRDVAAITVNRWPHAYAYVYNPVHDNPAWNQANGPHVRGRAQMHRVSIANSDSDAIPLLQGAINAADRAVTEQLDVR